MNVTFPRVSSHVLFGSNNTSTASLNENPPLFLQVPGAPDYFSLTQNSDHVMRLNHSQSQSQQKHTLDSIKTDVDVRISEFGSASPERRDEISRNIEKTLIQLSEKLGGNEIHKSLQGKALRIIRYTMHPESIGFKRDENPQRPRFFNRFHLHPWVQEQLPACRNSLVSENARARVMANLAKAWDNQDGRKKAHIALLINHHLKNGLIMPIQPEQPQPDIYEVASFVSQKALPHAFNLAAWMVPLDELFPTPKSIFRAFLTAAPERIYNLPMSQRLELAEQLEQAREKLPRHFYPPNTPMGPAPVSAYDVEQHQAKLARFHKITTKLSQVLKTDSTDSELPNYERDNLEQGIKALLDE